MLKITVELVPFGDESKKQTIATMDLWNDGKGTREYGWYEGKLWTEASPWRSTRDNRTTFVMDHERRASVWTLIKKAIENAEF